MRRLESIIEKYVVESGFKIRDIARASKRLSDIFTRERLDVERDYFADDIYVIAYVVHFTLTNANKVYKCLNMLPHFSERKINLLDLGCGSGAGSLAASMFFNEKFPEMDVHIVGVDRSTKILDVAKMLFERLENTNHSFKAILGSLLPSNLNKTLGKEKFDVIIASNFVNELLDADDVFDMLNQIIDANLRDDGYLIVVDPALKITSRPLMEVRDMLSRGGSVSIYSPCLHGRSCPMLAANDRDWCHFYIEWDIPDIVRQMDEFVGTDHKYLKMSYFIIRKGRYESGESNFGSEGTLYRIVSSPLISKGKLELILCGDDGNLRRIRRMNKDLSDDNRAMGNAKRGDIVKYGGADRLTKDARFEIITRWSAL